MDLQLLVIVGFLSLVLVATTATPTPEEYYWQSKLPNTPMPKTFRDLLPSDSGTLACLYSRHITHMEKSTGVNFGRKDVGVSNIRLGQAGYKDAAFYFREEDLVPGTTTMNLYLTKTTTMATFLPRQEAETIPFSSDKFSDILPRFSVVPGSNEAQLMKKTVQECEELAVQGEEKYCATSLESMVDFSISKLGINVQVVSTEVDKEETQEQKYTITGDVKKMASDGVIACHGRPYMYAVFYCHATENMRVYNVPLVGADGTKANAIAVCHAYRANMAFQVRKVKPAATLCHFLPEDQVVWVHN